MTNPCLHASLRVQRTGHSCNVQLMVPARDSVLAWVRQHCQWPIQRVPWWVYHHVVSRHGPPYLLFFGLAPAPTDSMMLPHNRWWVDLMRMEA